MVDDIEYNVARRPPALGPEWLLLRHNPDDHSIPSPMTDSLPAGIGRFQNVVDPPLDLIPDLRPQ
jgi:hypothetical protein